LSLLIFGSGETVTGNGHFFLVAFFAAAFFGAGLLALDLTAFLAMMFIRVVVF
jgi:hypothetical protein